jgi:hypothetical protein
MLNIHVCIYTEESRTAAGRRTVTMQECSESNVLGLGGLGGSSPPRTTTSCALTCHRHCISALAFTYYYYVAASLNRITLKLA